MCNILPLVANSALEKLVIIQKALCSPESGHTESMLRLLFSCVSK